MTDLLYLSVKQLEQVLGCPRKWALHNLFDAPYMPNQYAEEGNEVHAEIDAMIKGRSQLAPESRTAKMAAALYQRYAANRSHGAQSEIRKTISLPQYGVKVALRCDFADLAPPDSSLPVFRDWKVTGCPGPTARLKNGEFWTPQDISGMVQTNVYAFLLMSQYWEGWGVDAVQGELCFVCRKFDHGQEPKTWHVRHVFTREAVQKWWDTYIPPAAKLIRELKAAQLDNPLHVPHNGHHCEFSGKFCDAAGRCKFVSSPVLKYKDLHLPVLPDPRKEPCA